MPAVPSPTTGARVPEASSRGRRRPDVVRALALGLVLAAHGVGLALLSSWSQPRERPQQLRPIEVVLLDALPPPSIAPPPPRERPRAPPSVDAPVRSPPTVVADVVEHDAVEPDAVELDVVESESIEAPAPRLFAPDGSLLDIEAQADLLERRVDRRARFDYEIAGIVEAESAFTLPQAIDYVPTRFDRYWTPPTDLLTEVLEKAVSVSALTVSVPVPGMPGYRVGCTVVVLAAAGGCGMSEPKVLVYDIDDPNTLSPEEARACETIWQRITEATTQAEHRRLRRIYDLGCRLPLATGPSVQSR